MSEPGTYLLLMRLHREVEITVGRLGTFGFPAGFYCYVGSARGPSGIGARVRRHLMRRKRPHWHVDYLLGEAQVTEIWTTASTDRLECVWAQTLLSLPEVTAPVRGFGSSDCRCPAHLFYSVGCLSLRAFSRALESRGSETCLQTIMPATRPPNPRAGISPGESPERP
jgi:Uri superfamily endonuclease